MARYKRGICFEHIPRSKAHIEVFKLCMMAGPWIRQSPASHRGAQVLP